MTTRLKHTAEYLYPGAFFPEEAYRDLDEPTLAEALRKQPDEGYYFHRDGWYAVKIKTIEKELFHSESGEEKWITVGAPKVHAKIIVGQAIHADDIPDIDPDTGRDNGTLKRNIEYNSRPPLEGWGVLTRCGNWQIASDYDHVIAEADLHRVARGGPSALAQAEWKYDW